MNKFCTPTWKTDFFQKEKISYTYPKKQFSAWKNYFSRLKETLKPIKEKNFLYLPKITQFPNIIFFLYYEKTTIWTKNSLHLSERSNFSNQNVSYICPENFLYICLKKACFTCAKDPFLDKLFLKAYFKTSFLDVFHSAHNTNYSETNFLILSYFISIPN